MILLIAKQIINLYKKSIMHKICLYNMRLTIRIAIKSLIKLEKSKNEKNNW